MHVLAQDLLRLQTDHAGPGWVDENTQAFHVHTKNPFTRRSQHEAQGVTPGVGDTAKALNGRYDGWVVGVKQVRIKVHVGYLARRVPNLIATPWP
jgi:hypothetical protein